MDELLAEGITLMLFGMGFVIVFLTLLVVATTIMSRLVMRYEPVVAPVPSAGKAAASSASGQPDDQTLVAVMTAALQKFRADRNGQ